MILRGAGRAIAGLALVAAVSACDDNPLTENRDSAEYFRLSVSNAVVEVGGQIGVVANVLNQYGAALVVNVTASECNAGVSVAVDTVRSEYEYPERFIITGNSVGESCVVVNGGGITDTIDVRVVPAAVDVSLADPVVSSGATVPLTVTYSGTTGGAAAGIGFDPAHTTFSVGSSLIGVVDEDGNFTARAPGTTTITATYDDMGVTRTATVDVEVVAGAFTGTLSSNSGGAATMITLTAGAVPFDDDTQVLIDGVRTFVHSWTPTSMEVVVGTAENVGVETEMVIANMGPDQVAAIAPFTVTTNVEPHEPNNGLATALPMAVGDTAYFVFDENDNLDLARIILAADTDVRVILDWYPTGTDMDVYFYTAAGSQDTSKGGCGSATPGEDCTNSFTAGTWYIRPYNWGQDASRTTTLVRMILE